MFYCIRICFRRGSGRSPGEIREKIQWAKTIKNVLSQCCANQGGRPGGGPGEIWEKVSSKTNINQLMNYFSLDKYVIVLSVGSKVEQVVRHRRTQWI